MKPVAWILRELVPGGLRRDAGMSMALKLGWSTAGTRLLRSLRRINLAPSILTLPRAAVRRS